MPLHRKRLRLTNTRDPGELHPRPRRAWALVLQWRATAIGPTMILALSVMWALLETAGRESPPDRLSAIPAALMGTIATLLSVETFLVTFGLQFGRNDVYRRATEALRTEDQRFAERARPGHGALAMEVLLTASAQPLHTRKYALEYVLDPREPPRFSRRAPRRIMSKAAQRESESFRSLTGREGNFGLHHQVEENADLKEFVEAVLRHTRAAEARLVLVVNLAASILGLLVIAGASAGWGWSSHPAPEFLGLLVLGMTATGVCWMALLARHEVMDEYRDLLPDCIAASALAYQAFRGPGRTRPAPHDIELAYTTLARWSDNRFGLVLSAALLIDEPARRLAHGELPASLMDYERSNARFACRVLAPIVDRITSPDQRYGLPTSWRVQSKDLSAMLLRARVGELLQESEQVLLELINEALEVQTEMRYIAHGQSLQDANSRHLLPQFALPLLDISRSHA